MEVHPVPLPSRIVMFTHSLLNFLFLINPRKIQFVIGAALLVPTALGLVWLGPVISAIQHLVRPDMRATASAVFLFINNLIGIGIGTWAIGALSDFLQIRFGDDSLRYSILAGTLFYMMAAALFFTSARWLEKDWED